MNRTPEFEVVEKPDLLYGIDVYKRQAYQNVYDVTPL